MTHDTERPGWIDTHTHLQLVEDPAAAVDEAVAAGVSHLVCVGIDVATTRQAIDAARRWECVSATAGLHPHDAAKAAVEWDALTELAADADVVAVGECGLDFYRDRSPRDAQEEVFREHIRFSKSIGKALVVHSRDAWSDTFRVIEDEGPPGRLVFHCFSGGPDEARRAVDLGGYVSLAGPVGYPRNETLREAVRAIAGDHLDRLVVETDAPFLPPQRHRGERCRPAWTVLNGEALADSLGLAPAEVAAVTTANARSLFGLGT